MSVPYIFISIILFAQITRVCIIKMIINDVNFMFVLVVQLLFLYRILYVLYCINLHALPVLRRRTIFMSDKLFS